MPRVTRRRAPERTCAASCVAAAISFDEAVAGADRMTVAVTLFALLELYKQGEATWAQEVPFGPIAIQPATRDMAHVHDPAAGAGPDWPPHLRVASDAA